MRLEKRSPVQGVLSTSVSLFKTFKTLFKTGAIEVLNIIKKVDGEACLHESLRDLMNLGRFY